MFCSISGNAPESPVVSKITGHVYEKSLLEKYLVAEGKVCPPILFLFRAAGPLAPAPCRRTAHGTPTVRSARSPRRR